MKRCDIGLPGANLIANGGTHYQGVNIANTPLERVLPIL